MSERLSHFLLHQYSNTTPPGCYHAIIKLKTLKSGSHKLLAPPSACSSSQCTSSVHCTKWRKTVASLASIARMCNITSTLKRPRKDETKRCRRTKKKCSSCGLASHHEMMMTDPGDQGGRGPPPDFGRSVNPIQTRGADYAHRITACPPGFENLTASLCRYVKRKKLKWSRL